MLEEYSQLNKESDFPQQSAPGAQNGTSPSKKSRDLFRFILNYHFRFLLKCLSKHSHHSPNLSHHLVKHLRCQ